MGDVINRPLTLDDATMPFGKKPTAADQAWHDEQTRDAIEEADAGDFATPEEVEATIRIFVPNG